MIDVIDCSAPGPLTDLGEVSPAEISGNTVRDLAALNKVEMLPWDELLYRPELVVRRSTAPAPR